MASDEEHTYPAHPPDAPSLICEPPIEHLFGGSWTEEKLKVLREYLVQYSTALRNRPFQRIYIDAFAGTGYRTPKKQNAQQVFRFESDESAAANALLKGSATLALEVEPAFQQFIFIEAKAKHVQELEKLRASYPAHAKNIYIRWAKANDELQRICATRWSNRRAVLFLDPYGMQVSWKTIEAIAKTKAIDMWILFPAGIAVQRMLTNTGRITTGWQASLTRMFGTDKWYEHFYSVRTEQDLFGNREFLERDARIERIGEFFVERLKTIFPGVSPHPKLLSTPSGKPLYLLCFAAANANGAPIALRIADHLLRNA